MTATLPPTIDFHGLTELHAHHGDEIADIVRDALRAGPPIDGPPVRELEQQCAIALRRKHVAAVGSATDALTLALHACGIGPGDEVIVPSFSFIASAAPIAHVGATPVYVAVEPTNLHMTPEAVAAACTPVTRAVIAVHLFGQCVAGIDTLEELATSRGVYLIEDAAQAFGATHQGRPAGSFGHLSVLSFDPSKVLGGISTGGLLATDDTCLHRAVTAMRGHGHDPSTGEFIRLGINSRMSSANAAVLLNRLPRQEVWRQARAQVAERYHSDLAALPQLSLPPRTNAGSVDNHHKYVLRTAHRDELRHHLSQRGIPTKVHYHRALPDHAALAGHGRCHGTIDAARDAADCVLSLPIHPFLSGKQIGVIVRAVQDYPW